MDVSHCHINEQDVNRGFNFEITSFSTGSKYSKFTVQEDAGIFPLNKYLAFVTLSLATNIKFKMLGSCLLNINHVSNVGQLKENVHVVKLCIVMVTSANQS